MVADVVLTTPASDQVTIRALLNSSSDINLLREDVAIAYGFSVKPNKQTPNARFLDNNKITLYQPRRVAITATDSAGETKTYN